MPTAVTRLQMRTRVRSLANMETTSAPSFATDPEINGWLDDGIRALYDKLLRARGSSYYCVQSAPAALTPGVALYTLPATIYELLGVILFDGQTYYRPDPFQRADLVEMLNRQASGAGIADIRYCMMPTQIEFRPQPTGTGWTWRVDYVPAFTTLPDDVTGFDGVNGWEDWAVLWAAIRCLTKEESDTGALQAQLQVLDQRIEAMAPQRDAANPPTIRDTRGDRTGRYPARLRWLFKVP